MSILEFAEAILKRFPELSYEVGENQITVARPNDRGFSVWFLNYGSHSKYEVGFDRVWMPIEDAYEAINCFAWALTDRCLLRTEKQGDNAISWAPGCIYGDEWRGLGPEFRKYPSLSFWKRKTVEYLQNEVICGSAALEFESILATGLSSGVTKCIEKEGIQCAAGIDLFGPTETKLRELLSLSARTAAFASYSNPDLREFARRSHSVAAAAASYCSRAVIRYPTDNQLESRNHIAGQWRADFAGPDRWHVSQEMWDSELGLVHDVWISIGKQNFQNMGLWMQDDGLEKDELNRKLSVEYLLPILIDLEPASAATLQHHDVNYLILKYLPPIPERYRNGFLQISNEPNIEWQIEIWLDMHTDDLVRGTICGITHTASEELLEIEISQAFTCFDQDVVVEPPPWLNLSPTSEEGEMIVTDEKEVAIVSHHP